MASHLVSSFTPARPVRRDPVQGVLDDLRRIVQALRTAALSGRREGAPSAAQLFVLTQLAQRPAASLNELAARTRTDQSSVSVVVGRLVAQGHVHRRASEQDGRRRELSLTPAGKRLVERSPEPTQARLIAALEGLAPSDLGGLSQGLEALVRAMALTSEVPVMFFEEKRPGTPRTRRSSPLVRP